MKRIWATALLAASLLTACGGIGEDDNPINPYIGEWKACINSGSGYYTFRIYNFGKISESEAIMTTRSENQYTDAACSYRSVTEVRSAAHRVSLTGPITFLGKAGHVGTYNGGEGIYLAVENRLLYLAFGPSPTAWSVGLPKQ